MKLLQATLLQAELCWETPESRKASERVECIRKAKADWCKHLNAAHEVNHELNQLLPLIATDEYLYVNLEYELNKKKDPEGKFLITDLFEKKEIIDLGQRLAPSSSTVPSGPKTQEPPQSKSQDHRWAEQFLKRLSEARDEGWTYERALVKLKRYHLLLYAIIVSILLVPLGMVIISAGKSVDQLSDQFLLVTLVGALGSTLAAMIKLRDEVVQLNSLPLVVVAAVVQALVGASFGLVAWLLLRSGAVQIGGNRITDWETYALVAFASGFSEPFSLRLISRYIGTS
jgi:hypothetical protein